MDFVAEQWMLFGLLAVLVATLVIVEARKGGKPLNHHRATMLVNRGEAVVLDVREKKEYNAGHIVDALHIPYTKLAERHTELQKHKDKQIVVVDKMGQHAGSAVKTLRDNGYNAARMAGGMAEWQAQNLPVVKG